MKLSIIIVNYRQKGLVRQLLLGIDKQDIDFDFEVIIVDNDSKDNIESVIDDIKGKVNRDFLSRLSFVKLHKNLGMGTGNNRGAEKARGEYLLILNPDVVFIDRKTIQRLVDFADNGDEKIGCVAPMLLNPDKSIQQSRYKFPKIYIPIIVRTFLGNFFKLKIKEYLMEDVVATVTQKVDWIRGSVMLIKRNVFEKVGGFDERYFMYMEDVDLCRTLWDKGYEVWYYPEVKIIHYYGKGSGGERSKWQWMMDLFKKMAWVHIISWVKYFWKWREK